jgi:hypothetical protein
VAAGASSGAFPSSGGPPSPRGEEAEAPKVKSALVVAAERMDRQAALCSGYLRKQNSEGKWQRRYFEIVGNFFVYYKRHDSPVMLCSMDLWRASMPELAPATSEEPQPDTFGISWDRWRLFRANNHADAVRWVNAMLQVQSRRPVDYGQPGGAGAAGAPGGAAGLPAFAQPGGTIAGNSQGAGGQGGASKDGGPGGAEEWGRSKSKSKGEKADGGGGLCSGGCVVM